jgi:DNA-binding response OmpR family regulator
MKPMGNGVVLVVAEDEEIRNSLADILHQEGDTVHRLASGEETLSFLMDEQVDLLIIDQQLPGMSGLDVLRVVSKQAPTTRVILLTADGSLESAVEALRYQAFDYLIKPVSTDQLLDSVRRAQAYREALLQKEALLEEMEARLNQLLEAGHRPPNRGARPVNSQLVYLGNGVMVDFDRREVWGGPTGTSVRVHLTPAEGRLLKVLWERGGEVLTHRELVTVVQGYEVSDWEAPEILRPLVSRLRQKMANFSGVEQWIVNVRGTGYLFERRGPKGMSS